MCGHGVPRMSVRTVVVIEVMVREGHLCDRRVRARYDLRPARVGDGIRCYESSG